MQGWGERTLLGPLALHAVTGATVVDKHDRAAVQIALEDLFAGRRLAAALVDRVGTEDDHEQAQQPDHGIDLLAGVHPVCLSLVKPGASDQPGWLDLHRTRGVVLPAGRALARLHSDVAPGVNLDCHRVHRARSGPENTDARLRVRGAVAGAPEPAAVPLKVEAGAPGYGASEVWALSPQRDHSVATARPARSGFRWIEVDQPELPDRVFLRIAALHEVRDLPGGDGPAEAGHTSGVQEVEEDADRAGKRRGQAGPEVKQDKATTRDVRQAPGRSGRGQRCSPCELGAARGDGLLPGATRSLRLIRHRGPPRP